MDKFYTTEELAKMLHVTRRTILNKIKQGKIKALFFKGDKRNTYRIHEKELDRILAEGYAAFMEEK